MVVSCVEFGVGAEGRTEPTTHVDNEYSRAGILDPKIIVTTSRDPSSKLLQFAKVCQRISAVHGKKLMKR